MEHLATINIIETSPLAQTFLHCFYNHITLEYCIYLCFFPEQQAWLLSVIGLQISSISWERCLSCNAQFQPFLL